MESELNARRAGSDLEAPVRTENKMDYDPNLTLCGRTVMQEVKLKLQAWHYTGEMTVKVGGNCRGFDVLDAAVDIAYDKLLGDNRYASVTLTSENGDTLLCDDDEDKEEDWLKEMVVGIEILSITPAAKASSNDVANRRFCRPEET